MAQFTDLQPCTYFGLDSSALLAVGWLSAESRFEKGPVDVAFFGKLKTLCQDPWQPLVFAGVHTCELCQFDPPCFSYNLFIPYSGSIYAAPVGIVHYIAHHWYKPPDVFVEAVMACPEMHSMEYKRAILANSGRAFISSAWNLRRRIIRP